MEQVTQRSNSSVLFEQMLAGFDMLTPEEQEAFWQAEEEKRRDYVHVDTSQKQMQAVIAMQQETMKKQQEELDNLRLLAIES